MVELPDGGRRLKSKLVDKIRTLETLGKHVGVNAFNERDSGDAAFHEMLEYVLEQREQRRLAKGDGDGRLATEPSPGSREDGLQTA